MRTILRDGFAMRERMARSGGLVVSAVAHVVVLLFLFVSVRHGVRIAPMTLPGTAQGVRFITYYSPGSAQPVVNDLAVKDVVKPVTESAVHTPKDVLEAKSSQTAAATERGSGTSAISGRGEGNVTIALQKFFPYPKPDLSGMARGTHGDVILNAVIDEHGAIGELTLVQGLGPAIDDVVIATVRQWSYQPATRDGVPVASEQELHFHYERG